MTKNSGEKYIERKLGEKDLGEREEMTSTSIAPKQEAFNGKKSTVKRSMVKWHHKLGQHPWYPCYTLANLDHKEGCDE